MKYRCIKDFQVTVCDGDGFFTEQEEIIKAGTTWIDEGDSVVSCGDVHLENQDGTYTWVELCKEDLAKYFEEIK